MDQEKSCCVPSCKRPRSPGTPIHGFPSPKTDPDRFRAWVHAVGGNIYTLQDDYIYKHRRICRHHFETRFRLGNNRLAKTAIPTINMTGIHGHTRQPMRDITSITTNVENVLDNVNLPENVMPSTSKAQIPGTQDIPRTTLKVGALKQPSKKEVTMMSKQIKKLKLEKANYSQRLKKAMKLTENATFLKILKSFSTMAALFTLMQFREIKKPKLGRRFSQDEKIMALSLYKQGPRAYRWLSKLFVLPSPMTLSRLITRAGLKAGINENIFKQLKKVAAKLKEHDKLCVLIFDEIALSPHFDYNQRKDRITGFVDNGILKQRNVADHALVFMIRGIIKNYKQPLSYTFCSGSTKKEELARQIKENISKLQSVGFNVLATICDQGASNVSAINKLIEESKSECLRNGIEFKNEIFKVNDKEIIPLYDPPHLIKGIRNNFLTKNIKYTMQNITKVAKWQHLQMLYEENPTYKGIRLIKNLTEAHINPDKLNKQKVKYATQVFSETVASSMGFLAEKGLLPEECKQTADILLFFDGLFDSVNGSFNNSKKRSGKELLRQLTPKSKHEEIWREAKQVLHSMKFITMDGKECTPPSIKNWTKTINGIQYLREKLFKEYDFKSVWLRHLNQDPLENFFGCIRSHGAQNTKPSCAAFESAFASLLINNINSNYSPGSNCEEDSCKVFKQISKIIEQAPQKKSLITNIDYSHLEHEIEDFNLKKENPRIMASINYVAGYILHKAKQVFKTCKICRKNLFTEKDVEGINMREYKIGKRWLTYPSNDMVECFSEIQDIITNVLSNGSSKNNIKEYIKTLLYVKVNYSFLTCEKHKVKLVNFIFDLSARFFIYSWCRDVNKSLNGSDKSDYEEDEIKRKCVEYYKKMKKKK